MNAVAFADLLRARPSGLGRYQARCPAHPDRSPSLTVTAGEQGRVLLRCWSHGCEPKAIVAALGLTMRDLFNDAPMNPRAKAKAREQQAARQAEERRHAQLDRRAGDLYRRAVRAADTLGTRLAYAPDGPEGDALTAVALRAFRLRDKVESSYGGPESERLAKVTDARPSWSPFLEPDAEAAEAWRVTTEVQRLNYIGTGYAQPLARGSHGEQTSPWRWTPSRLPDVDIGDALYAAQLDTVEEFEALRGNPRAHSREETQSLVASGALRITA